MAKANIHTFECRRYPSLSFYVSGKKKKFENGVYKTSALKEIRVLSNLSDVEETGDSDRMNIGGKDD